MKQRLTALALLSTCAAVCLAPNGASAVPKMDVKVAVGVGSTTLVPRLPDIDLYLPDSDPLELLGTVGGRYARTFPNWGMQLSARVTAGKIFGEVGIGFSRFYFEVGQELVWIQQAEGGTGERLQKIVGERARMNSLEIPLTAGYVPYKNPYFKLFLYGGWVSTFNIRGFVDFDIDGDGDSDRKAFKFKPKDIPGYPLAIYLAGARFGAQFDLGPLNFDISYTIGMNSITATDYRTNSHVFKFFLGWLF